jgi:hypothetical protein
MGSNSINQDRSHPDDERLLKLSHKLMPVILATQKAEIRRNTVQSQPDRFARPNFKKLFKEKKRAGGVAQAVRVSTLQ